MPLEFTFKRILEKALLTFGLLLITFGSYSQSFVVSSKKNITIPTKKIFSWSMQSETEIECESNYFNDSKVNADIKNAITEELQNLGYTQNKTNPAILVKFSVLTKPSRLYNFERFNSNERYLSGRKETSDKINYNVDPGTLLISFIQPNTNKIIWEGFASGLIDSQAIRQNTLMANEAVRLIMQEYASLLDNSSAHLN